MKKVIVRVKTITTLIEILNDVIAEIETLQSKRSDKIIDILIDLNLCLDLVDEKRNK